MIRWNYQTGGLARVSWNFRSGLKRLTAAPSRIGRGAGQVLEAWLKGMTKLVSHWVYNYVATIPRLGLVVQVGRRGGNMPDCLWVRRLL